MIWKMFAFYHRNIAVILLYNNERFHAHQFLN